MFNLRQEIAAGVTLIREALQSSNFVAGVSGWRIKTNGDAEFNNLIARGVLIAGPIQINGVAYPNAIALFTGNVAEITPAIIDPHTSAGRGYVRYAGPTLKIGATPATFDLSGYDDGHSTAELDTDTIRMTSSTLTTIESSSLRLSGDFSTYISFDTGYALVVGQSWIGTAITPLAGTWIDTAGARFGYTKDATGRVSVRGKLSGGGAGATLVSLPAGYRPSSNLDFSMRSGTTLCAVSVSTAGVLTVSANLATATVSGINLDVISFPTL